jgi:hypothetical protein
MSNPWNMVQLVKALPSRPRGRACIVLTHEYESQKAWSAELARQTESEHINLLDHFTENETLGNQLGQFLVPRLFEFLKDFCQAPVLIVSGMEFLKATWIGQPNAIEQFASYVKTWDKSPCLLFVLQYDKILATYDFGRRFQYTFVVDQKETLAL